MTRTEKRLAIKEFLVALREMGIKRTRHTIWRWYRYGAILRRGRPERLRLEGKAVGGRMHFSLESYERFERKLSEARE